MKPSATAAPQRRHAHVPKANKMRSRKSEFVAAYKKHVAPLLNEELQKAGGDVKSVGKKIDVVTELRCARLQHIHVKLPGTLYRLFDISETPRRGT